MRSLRRPPPAVPVGPGERLLAWATAGSGEVLAGTRDALYVGARRIPWEEVEAADWDRDTSLFRVCEVGHWGEQRVEHALALDDPDRLLQLVRERVTASVVLVRHVPLEGRRGVRVVARQAPGRRGPLTWVHEYDEGIDPDDPLVQITADELLRASREEVGLG
ncbi:MAG: hypothetical protein ACR2K3_13750 [Nocardioides sp.]